MRASEGGKRWGGGRKSCAVVPPASDVAVATDWWAGRPAPARRIQAERHFRPTRVTFASNWPVQLPHLAPGRRARPGKVSDGVEGEGAKGDPRPLAGLGAVARAWSSQVEKPEVRCPPSYRLRCWRLVDLVREGLWDRRASSKTGPLHQRREGWQKSEEGREADGTIKACRPPIRVAVGGTSSGSAGHWLLGRRSQVANRAPHTLGFWLLAIKFSW